MKKLHGLVISWYYPPGNSSEGLVTYKLLKNSQFSYDVFTRQPFCGSMWDRKTDESALTADNVTIHQAASTDANAWVKEAVEYYAQNHDKYDFVMSRVMPVDSHLAAAEMKAQFPETKWLASFGDPLVNSPYIECIRKNQNPFFLQQYLWREHPSLAKTAKLAISPTRLARKKIWEKERTNKMLWPLLCEKANNLAFEQADALIFNNQYQYDRAFADEFAKFRDKGVIINHGFDKTLYPEAAAPAQDGKKHFLYVGHLDEMRSAKPLFIALGKLKKTHPNLAKKVQFDFYGHMSDQDKAAIIDHQIGKFVTVHPDISYLESLEKISQADWLILIDANLNSVLNDYIYFPAKLVDYLGAEKPIFAITQTTGTSADAIRQIGAGRIVTHDPDDIYLYLAKIIEQDYNPTKYCQKALAQYNAKNVASTFDQYVLEHIYG